MKMKCLITIVVLMLHYMSTAQTQDYVGSENIFDVIIYKPDSISLKNNIENLKIFYKERKNVYKLIVQKNFDKSGRVKKIVYFDYLSARDSVVIFLPMTANDIYTVRTTLTSSSFDKDFRGRETELSFPKSDYKKLINSAETNNVFDIEKTYKLNNDRYILVSTSVNKKVVKNFLLINPFSKYADNQFIIGRQYDTTYINDTMVLVSKNEDSTRKDRIYKISYLNNKIVKDESLHFNNGVFVDCLFSNWKYDRKGRLIYSENGIRDQKEIKRFLVKKIRYSPDGGRQEIEDKNPADGKIDLINKYDKNNNLLIGINYHYQYVTDSNQSLKSTASIVNKYNEKGLKVEEKQYFNTALQSVKRYFYTFYNKNN